MTHEDLLIPNALSKFCISPDGKLLAISNSNGALFFFNLISQELVEIYDHHNVMVLGIDWDPDSESCMATLDKSGLLYLWE